MKKYRKKLPIKNIILFVLLAFALCFMLSGCRHSDNTVENNTIKYRSPSDFTGAVIGSQTGTVFDDILNNAIPGLKHKYYDDITGQILALHNKDIDAVGLDEPVARLVAAQKPDYEVFDQIIQTDSYGFAISKNSELTDQMSNVIEAFAADGTLDKLKAKWFSGDSAKMHIDMNEYTGCDTSNGVIRYIHDSTQTPMSYVDDSGNSAGYEVEIVLKAAKKLKKKVEITQANFSALMMAVSSGKADIASGSISITDERRESVDFPTTHYTGGIVLLCRKQDVLASSVHKNTQNTDFLATIGQSFNKTLIKENRWKMIVSGLLVTMLISLCALVIGTLLGFIICMLRRSKNRCISAVTAIFIRLIQGIPLVVLLMLLYYIVFSNTGLNGTIVAVIGFSLNFGVNAAEIIRTGIKAVDKGQLEAASALGMSKWQSGVKIVFPQSIRIFLPAYKGEFINMMKMTSVVGYIAVQDLTKASDIIRSRTYEAYLPLIISTCIYLLMAWLLTSLIGLIEIKFDYKNHKKIAINPQQTNIDNEQALFGNIPNTSGEIIKIEHLYKDFDGLKIFSDLNTSINSGEVIAVIGPSGEGKSTLLRMIKRIETPTEGKIYFNGIDTANQKEWNSINKKIGMVLQTFNLFQHLNVIENLMLAPMTVLKMPRNEAYANAFSLLRAMGLAGKASYYPDELSGGQKQRVAIARALAMKPEMILFDEPTSALDPTAVSEILNVIRSLAKSGITMLIVTHEMQFAKDVSTRIFYIDQGEIYESGTPQQIFDAPQRERTRRFIRRLNMFEENICSENIDFIEIDSKIEKFCHTHRMPQQIINKLRTIFEELAVQTILPSLAPDILMSVIIEYTDESDKATMYIRYNGKVFNPTQNDDLSMILARHSSEMIRYISHPDDKMKNEIVIDIK